MIPDNEKAKIEDYIKRNAPEHLNGFHRNWLEYVYIDHFNGGCHIYSDYNTEKEKLVGTVLY